MRARWLVLGDQLSARSAAFRLTYGLGLYDSVLVRVVRRRVEVDHLVGVGGRIGREDVGVAGQSRMGVGRAHHVAVNPGVSVVQLPTGCVGSPGWSARWGHGVDQEGPVLVKSVSQFPALSTAAMVEVAPVLLVAAVWCSSEASPPRP